MYLLVLISLLHFTTLQPQVVGQYSTPGACQVAAADKNKSSLNARGPEKDGLLFVCYQIQPTT